MSEEQQEEQDVFIDFRAVLRGMIYDTGVDDPECHARVLGLSLITDEGMEMEQKLSNTRMDSIDKVGDLLIQNSALLSMVMSSIHYNLPHLDLDDPRSQEVLASAAKTSPLYAAVAVTSAATFLSLLLEHGVVAFTAKHIKVQEFERE